MSYLPATLDTPLGASGETNRAAKWQSPHLERPDKGRLCGPLGVHAGKEAGGEAWESCTAAYGRHAGCVAAPSNRSRNLRYPLPPSDRQLSGAFLCAADTAEQWVV